MNALAAPPGPEPFISAADYENFCAYFYRTTGISFGDNKRYFVDKRLIERIQKSGAKDFAHYFADLKRSGAAREIELLTSLLTVNETYFFREDHQFQALAQNMLPEITARRQKGARVRIWSLPCSTGEEPYSIALYLLEHWAAVDDFEIEIIASDIDTAALGAAQAGIYDARALHRLPRGLVQRYFTNVAGDKFQLAESIRGSVRFSQINCTDPAAMSVYSQVDVIFCRNMLIYFDDKSRLAAVQLMFDCMSPGGFICLGHSESMSRISAIFSLRSFPQAMVYQKKLGVR